MATRSSTSSSEPIASVEARLDEHVDERMRPPWALLLALLLIALVEFGVRQRIPREDFLDAHTQPKSSLQQVIDTDGAAEIAFLGSSVSWNGLATPLIATAVGKELERTVHVANYSFFGARAEMVTDIAHVVARADRPPRVAYYCVTLHALTRAKQLLDTSWLWAIEDWRREYHANGVGTFEQLPIALTNELARHCRTLEMRRNAPAYLDRLWSGEEFPLAPMRGGWVESHRTHPGLMLKGRRELIEAEDRLEQALADRDLAEAGENVGDYYDPRRIVELGLVFDILNAVGTDVVYVELPLPTMHTIKLPAGVYEQFQSIVARLVAERGTRYVRFADLGITMSGEDYKDASHMNGRGAQRVTEALIQREILPYTRRVLAR